MPAGLTGPNTIGLFDLNIHTYLTMFLIGLLIISDNNMIPAVCGSRVLKVV